jgi:hypothetical protein
MPWEILARLNDEGRHGAAAAGSDVEQCRGGQARQAARSVGIVPDVRIGVERALDELQAALPIAGIRLAGHIHALLHDGRRVKRISQGALPHFLRHRPSQDDALAAVFISRLEHEALAMLRDEGEQVYALTFINREALGHDARPRDELRDGALLVRGKAVAVDLVAQDG